MGHLTIYFCTQLHLLNVLGVKTKKTLYFVLELLCFPAACILNITNGLLGMLTSAVLIS